MGVNVAIIRKAAVQHLKGKQANSQKHVLTVYIRSRYNVHDNTDIVREHAPSSKYQFQGCEVMHE